MKPWPSPASRVYLFAILCKVSVAFNDGSGSNGVQTTGTVEPYAATDSTTPIIGLNDFGDLKGLTQSMETSPGRAAALHGQPWSSSEAKGSSNQDWPLQIDFQVGSPSSPGSPMQLNLLSNPNEGHVSGTLGVDCSGSGAGGFGCNLAPKSGLDLGTLNVDSSGFGNTGGTRPSSVGTLRADCSGACSDLSATKASSTNSGLEDAKASTPDTLLTTPTSPATDTLVTTPTSPTTGTLSIEEVKASTTDTPSTNPTSLTTDTLSTTPNAETLNVSQTPTMDSVASKFKPTEANLAKKADETPKQNVLESSGSSDSAVTQQQPEQQGETTAGGDVIESMSVWGAPVVASTGTNHSSVKPTFGEIVNKSGECVVADPTEYISAEYLDWVWQHRIGPDAPPKANVNWNVMENTNFLMDKFVHNQGSINYCVRWDSSTNLDKPSASLFQGILERHYNKWNKWLEGYNCWPFKELKVNMVGWAAKDKSQFEWTDDTLGAFYVGSVDANGVPQCPDECYRFHDSASGRWSDTSACTGEPFDVSFWLSESISNGFGFDWGQQLSLNNTMEHLYDENIMFVGHEIGHGFGLPDFYGPETKPSNDFPNSIMMAYSSTTITASDGWMLRRILDHVRSRYDF